MARMAIAIALSLATNVAARAETPPRRWLRANFHAHTRADAVDDDGVESPLALHRALRAAGFDVSLHTPHCLDQAPPEASAAYARQRSEEGRLAVPGLTIAVGQELTVADGPHYARSTKLLGRSAPGNLNHLTIVGAKDLLPFRQLSPAEACQRAHADGGICIVNHPGPGPMMWEEGYWESPRNRAQVDALEVYNGQALSAAGVEFEGRYLEATSYRGLGLKLAATTGADTHGPRSVARVKSRLAGFAGGASKLVQLLLPQSASERPELDAATLVGSDGTRIEDVIAAVRARRTIAVYALPRVGVELDGVGEVRHGGDVRLTLSLSRKLPEVTLYREGVAVHTWHDVDHVEWSEGIDAPAAYVFGARDGAGRLMTSAIWYEPGR